MPIKYSASNHYPVYAVIDLENNITLSANDTHKTKKYSKYTHFKPNDYLKDLQNAYWLDSNKTTCMTDECFNKFANVFSNILNKHLPMVKEKKNEDKYRH